MKRKLIVLGCLLVSSLTIGCTRKIETQTIETVTLKVKNVYHRSMWLQTVPCGKSVSVVTHPERNEVEFDYNGYEIEVNSKDIYEYCKDKKTVKAKIYKITYDTQEVDYDFKEIIE